MARPAAILAGLGLLLAAALPAAGAGAPADEDADMRFRIVDEPVATDRADAGSTADHSKFEALQGPFAGGPEVTEACLSCHTEAADQFMRSLHWTWEYIHPETGQELGKRHLINNFCTNARSNEGMCAQCHASHGWEQADFEPDGLDWESDVEAADPRRVDCLVCHDRTGTYYKLPPTEGNEACAVMFEGKEPIDLAKVARSVDRPGRENCGACHFYGGGGDGVKHGDLDSSLVAPPRSLDVHMAADGADFPCTECHVSDRHTWAGSRYHVTARDTEGTGQPGLRRDVATCESCHGLAPHPVDGVTGYQLNGHVDRVACQSCHIPTIARGGVATKVEWDWRTAGKTRNGEGYKLKEYTQGDGAHRATYKSIKGSFEYREDFVPHYAWFDGQMHYTTIDTVFDPAEAPIAINRFGGAADDPDARIWPFKRMHTVQPFDKGNNTLVYMHLWGEDDAAFWGNYDFAEAIAAGMEENGIPYSGEWGFIETYSYWPITHMVAPKEDAVACGECHAAKGRLAGLTGFYLPGRRAPVWLDWLGWLLVGGTLLGVLGHAALRGVAVRGEG